VVFSTSHWPFILGGISHGQGVDCLHNKICKDQYSDKLNIYILTLLYSLFHMFYMLNLYELYTASTIFRYHFEPWREDYGNRSGTWDMLLIDCGLVYAESIFLGICYAYTFCRYCILNNIDLPYLHNKLDMRCPHQEEENLNYFNHLIKSLLVFDGV
jgi:hypothetical protein